MVSKIVSRVANKFLVATSDRQILIAVSRKKLPPLAIGDLVETEEPVGTDEVVIIKLVPRKNLITRPDPFNKFDKPLVANVDVILAVVAPKPKPDLRLLDEYTVLAEFYQVELVIIVNKQDIGDISDLLADYQKLKINLIATNAINSVGIEKVNKILKDKVGIFVGQSGVGKSSLINCLLPEQNLKTKQLSNIELGKHTTSHTSLHYLNNSGEIIDSPGIREFGLWKLEKTQIVKGFREIYQASINCKFNNCQHINEPNCAVKFAVNNNQISSRRYASYCKLIVGR